MERGEEKCLTHFFRNWNYCKCVNGCSCSYKLLQLQLQPNNEKRLLWKSSCNFNHFIHSLLQPNSTKCKTKNTCTQSMKNIKQIIGLKKGEKYVPVSFFLSYQMLLNWDMWSQWISIYFVRKHHLVCMLTSLRGHAFMLVYLYGTLCHQ